MTISFVPPARAFCLWSIQITLGNKKCLNFLRIIPVSNCHGNPKPSFLGLWPIFWGVKPSFFMVLGSKGGGFKDVLNLHLDPWANFIQFDFRIFSNGLVLKPPPRNELITLTRKSLDVACIQQPRTSSWTITRRVFLEVLAIKPYQSNSLFDFQGQTNLFSSQTYAIPTGSMYGICTYIYHQKQPHVGKYTIHGRYAICNKRIQHMTLCYADNLASRGHVLMLASI